MTNVNKCPNSKLIWQKAASPSCHTSRRRMHSSAACAGQAHSPVAAAGEQYAMHSRLGRLHWAGTWPLQKYPFAWGSGPHQTHGSLDPRDSGPKRHLDRFSRFCTAHPCAQHIDTQITLRATSLATGRIYARDALAWPSILHLTAKIY